MRRFVSPLWPTMCAFCEHVIGRYGAARFFLTKLSIDRNTENIQGPHSVVAVFPVLTDATERAPLFGCG